MKAGVINTLSIDGVRQINEVKLYEFSPVVFESNDQATIDNVRSESFTDTLKESELRRKGWLLTEAFEDTMGDILWGESTIDEAVQITQIIAQLVK